MRFLLLTAAVRSTEEWLDRQTDGRLSLQLDFWWGLLAFFYRHKRLTVNGVVRCFVKRFY
jgi:hypothetical protein